MASVARVAAHSHVHGRVRGSDCVSNVWHCEVYANVVSSGGTAMFQVTSERTTVELTALAPFTTKILVVAPQE